MSLKCTKTTHFSLGSRSLCFSEGKYVEVILWAKKWSKPESMSQVQAYKRQNEETQQHTTTSFQYASIFIRFLQYLGSQEYKTYSHVVSYFPPWDVAPTFQLLRIRTWREDFVAPSNMGMISGWQVAHFPPRFFPAKDMKQHGEHMGKTMFWIRLHHANPYSFFDSLRVPSRGNDSGVQWLGAQLRKKTGKKWKVSLDILVVPTDIYIYIYIYPLVIQHSHGKSPFLIGKPSINWPFSMAMLNN